METTVFKRSVSLGDKHTSMTLEDDFWEMLKEIAHSRAITIAELVAEIDSSRTCGSLSSAVRVYLFRHCRDKLMQYEKTGRLSAA